MSQDVALICFEFVSRAWEALSKTAKNIRIVGVPAEIRARHFLNASQKQYCLRQKGAYRAHLDLVMNCRLEICHSVLFVTQVDGQECTNAGLQVAMTTEFCTVARLEF